MKKLLIMLSILALMCIPLSGCRNHTGRKEILAESQRFDEKEYTGVFMSMYPVTNWNEEHFEHYLGIPTIKISFIADSVKEWEILMDSAKSKSVPLEAFFLGVDPEKTDVDLLISCLDKWFDYFEGASARILLPVYSIDYWTEKSHEETLKALDKYRKLIDGLDKYDNVAVNCFTGEEWLISLDRAYEAAQPVTEACDYMFLHGFGSDVYILDSGNFDTLSEKLLQAIENENNEKYCAGKGKRDVVIFGDSICANEAGVFSLKNYFSEKTDMNMYLLAKGGMTASYRDDMDLCMTNAVDVFTHAREVAYEDSLFFNELRRYRKDNALNHKSDKTKRHERHYEKRTKYNRSTKKCRGRKQIFILEYGLNDFFNACPVENPMDEDDVTTFAGAYRNAIKKLRKAYPDSEIILWIPYYTYEFEQGTVSPYNGAPEKTYIECVRQIGEKYNLEVMDFSTLISFGIDNVATDSYDGTHPRPNTIKIISDYLLHFLENE